VKDVHQQELELAFALENAEHGQNSALFNKAAEVIRQMVLRNTYLIQYRTYYEEAMVASNEVGYSGISAADTIRDMDKTISDLYTKLDRGTE